MSYLRITTYSTVRQRGENDSGVPAGAARGRQTPHAGGAGDGADGNARGRPAASARCVLGSKLLLVFAVAVFASLASCLNVLDYVAGLLYLTCGPGTDILPGRQFLFMRQSVSPALDHPVYFVLIALEIVTAMLCWTGMIWLWARRRAGGAAFEQAKLIAMAGLATAFVTWQVAWITNGGEWFDTWSTDITAVMSGHLPVVVTFVLVVAMIYFMAQDASRAGSGARQGDLHAGRR